MIGESLAHVCKTFSFTPKKQNNALSERDTLAKYSERLALVGLQLSALRLWLRLRLRLWLRLRLRLRLRRSCGGARLRRGSNFAQAGTLHPSAKSEQVCLQSPKRKMMFQLC